MEPQLYSIIFGESVLNDAVAIVLFQVGFVECVSEWVRGRETQGEGRCV